MKTSICKVSFIARLLFPTPDNGSLKIYQNEEEIITEFHDLL